MGQAHGEMTLAPFWPTKPGDDDYGDNEVRSPLEWARHTKAVTILRTAGIPLILATAATILMLTSTCEGHCFRVWHYPKAQRCYTALAPEHTTMRHMKRLIMLEQGVPKQEQPVNLIDFEPQQRHAPPWPTLEDINWGAVGDERTQGIAKLRALSNGP